MQGVPNPPASRSAQTVMRIPPLPDGAYPGAGWLPMPAALRLYGNGMVALASEAGRAVKRLFTLIILSPQGKARKPSLARVSVKLR